MSVQYRVIPTQGSAFVAIAERVEFKDGMLILASGYSVDQSIIVAYAPGAWQSVEQISIVDDQEIRIAA